MYDNNYGKPCLNGAERRCGFDRRNHSLTTLVYALHGRRALGRRQDDHINALVDRHEPKFFFVSLGIILLCCLDAVFTLRLIDAGLATEANPIMRWVMAEGVAHFLIVKFVCTTLAVLVLLLLKHFYFARRIKISVFLYAALGMYLLLIKYELWLFSLA